MGDPPSDRTEKTAPFMTREISRNLVNLTGPGRILHYGCTSPHLVYALLEKGCDAFGEFVDNQAPAVLAAERFFAADHAFPAGSLFDAVIVDPHLLATTHDCAGLLAECRRRSKRFVVLWAAPTDTDQGPAVDDHEMWEAAAVRSGFRRHLGSFSRERYHRLNTPFLEPLTCFEKVDDQMLAAWPLEALLRDRNLHMDMSREAGGRADAHLVRYALACEWIRRGDTVLDCACGLGYGSALMAGRSLGHRFLGVDIDEGSIRYAADHFARYRIDYRQGSACDLGFLADGSVDFVSSFETIEHLEDYEPFLAEVARVLRPDGRFIASVPNLWVDETGTDPNPYHFHAFDYAKLKEALEKHFLIEARYAQTAPGGFKLAEARRSLEKRPLEATADEEDTEWWIMVASADPTRRRVLPYSHPEFDRSALDEGFHVTDFSGHYRNPWIYRSLIQIGERVREPELLTRLIDQVLVDQDPVSPDYGGALTVKGYALLAMPQPAPSDHFQEVMAACEDYLAIPVTDPHQARWQTSLAFLGGLLALRTGLRERAVLSFERAQRFDPIAFSPLIATKCVAAAYLAGIIRLADGQPVAARTQFLSGVDIARRALRAPDENAVGNPEAPLTFGFQELADVAEIAGQCAVALRHLDEFPRDPGRFYRLVNVRRIWDWQHEAVVFDMRNDHHSARNDLLAIGDVVRQLRHESTSLRRLINRLLDRFFNVRLVKNHMLDQIEDLADRHAG